MALHLAERLDGELVNADSVQLYRGFDIGSAKTPVSERRGIPHHLFDVLNAQTVPSAGDYARMARETVAGISERGKLPIVVGGTGFYVRAFLDGLLPCRRATKPSASASWPAHRVRCTAFSPRLEPTAAARIQPQDTQKLIRALEIRLLTNAALPLRRPPEPLTGFDVIQLGLDPPREALVDAIAARTRVMFDQGLLDEVTQPPRLRPDRQRKAL